MRILLIAILSCCLLASCGPGSGAAAEYNDAIITEQNKVANKGEAFYAAMDLSKEELQKAFAAFCAQVDSSISLTKELGPFDGKTEFLDAAMHSLELYRSICGEEYKLLVETLSKPEDEISEEDTEKYHAAIKAVEEKLNPVMDQLDAAQLKFAQENDFTIDANKTFE
jgi:hypothetical protein